MTIKEIAQLAGVSISTVSKVINRKDTGIRPETRERVLQIVKEFNYSPYANAIPNTGSTFILGVLVSSHADNQILNGIFQVARAQSYTILVAETNHDPETEHKGITALCRHKVDALLWEPVDKDSLRHADDLRSANIPYLLFHSDQFEDAYNINFEQIGYFAASALIRARHRNIACLLSPGIQSQPFLNGYKRCLFESGIPLNDNMIFHDVDDLLLRKIANHSVTGVASTHLGTSLYLYEALRKLHYHIPTDVSLISLRKDSQKDIQFPPISTITIPYRELGFHLGENFIRANEQGGTVPPFEFEVCLDNTLSIQIPYEQRQQKLTVIGSINLDNYLKVEALPVTGTTVMTSNTSLYSGGKAINQSVGASKLGANVNLIGAVGTDMDSDIIFSFLSEHAIDASGIRRCANEVTGKAYIFVQPDGDSMISILSGANNALRPDDILDNERAFKDCRYCLMQTEVPQEALIQAGKIAHKYGAKTILKPSACTVLDKKLLKYIDIIIPNRKEINVLCPGKSLSEQADYFLNSGIETVIITLGKDGCYLKTKQEEEYFSASDFTPIDNTGAGDAFICALAVYLQRGHHLRNAIKIATYAAGFSITREGVTPSLIDRNTLEAYIRQKEPALLDLPDTPASTIAQRR